MIVLAHQIYLLVESFINWLHPAENAEGEEDVVKNENEIDGRIPEDEIDGRFPVVEEVIQSDVSKSSLYAAPKLPDYTDETLNFPFLLDQKTINYVQQAKVMFIMRGLPGSGKSSIVERISNVYRNSAVCSADLFFMCDGVYKWDHSKLSEAHNTCQEKAKAHCENGTPVVIIDNTNIKKWEMNRYLQFASENSYPVVIVEPKTPWKNDPVKLAQFNSHGVTEDLINSKLKSFDQVFPLYFGWFLNENQSDYLINIAMECLHHISASFQDVIKEESFEINSKRMLHCTAMFMGSRNFPTPKRKTYPYSEEVQRSYGSVFDLKISRLAITSRSIGFQVQLSQEGLKLYERPETDKREELLKATLQRDDVYLVKGCAAHITVVTVDGVKPKTTGDDILEIVCKEFEALSNKTELPKFKIPIGSVTRVTENMFVIDLNADKQRIMRGLFTGYYGNGGGGTPRRC